MAPKQQNVGSALFLLALLVAASVPRVEAAHDRKLLNIWDSITVTNAFTSFQKEVGDAVDAIQKASRGAGAAADSRGRRRVERPAARGWAANATLNTWPASVQQAVGNVTSNLQSLATSAESALGSGVNSVGNTLKDAIDSSEKANSTDAAESYKSTITSYGSVVVKVANAALDRIDDKSGSLAAALATAAANASSALDSARDKLTPGALGFNETNKEATLNTIAAAAQGTAVVQDAKGLTSDAARNATDVLTNVTRQFALLLSGAPGNSTRASSSS
eukprot:scaffold23.g4093.t1